MNRYIASPLPVGTRITFGRRDRGKRGETRTWNDTGRIKKVEVYSYVVQSDDGDLFIRRFSEVTRL